jgi:hypothetical protein
MLYVRLLRAGWVAQGESSEATALRGCGMRRFGVGLVCAAAIIATGTAPLAALSSNDKSIAQAGVVTLQDLPTGWAPKPSTSSGAAAALTPKLVLTIPVCKPFRPLLGNSKTAVKARSSSFTDGSVSFDNSVTVYPDVNRASRPFAAVKAGTGFSRCFEQILQIGLRKLLVKSGHASQVTNLNVSVQSANPGTGAGDDQAAFAATVALRIQGIDQTLYFESVIVRVGRALDTFNYENDSSPIADTMNAVIATSVGRLGVALGTVTSSSP